MKWVTTNIRFPEDMYMDLKLEAARNRKSFAELVREKIVNKKARSKIIKVEKIIRDLDKLAKENNKYLKGIDSTKIIREMRDER